MYTVCTAQYAIWLSGKSNPIERTKQTSNCLTASYAQNDRTTIIANRRTALKPINNVPRRYTLEHAERRELRQEYQMKN